jgi:type IV pilus assembly protein PilV
MHNLQNLKQLTLAKTQEGVVLLEALIGIVIFSFGILAISGLQAAMIKNTTDSNYRAEASYIVQQELGKMWAKPSTIKTLADSSAAISNRLPDGNLAISRISDNRFQFVVTWQTPGEPQHNYTAVASIDP